MNDNLPQRWPRPWRPRRPAAVPALAPANDDRPRGLDKLELAA